MEEEGRKGRKEGIQGKIMLSRGRNVRNGRKRKEREERKRKKEE